MQIGLWSDSHNFPNLCSMKISAYYKSRGHTTELYDKTHSYDLIFASKVFTETTEPDFGNTRVVRGGTGYDLHNNLPDEIEHIYPDYSLYPDFKPALGVLTRGCPRLNHARSRGGFCITPDKDGCLPRKVADITEFWNGQSEIILLDQNLLAVREKMELLQQLIDTKALITFNGGMDVRYINNDIVDMFRKMKVKDYHFAWDDPRENLEPKFKLLSESGLLRKDSTGVFVLTNFWSNLEEDLHRIYTLRKYNFLPYVMVYDKMRYVNKNGRWKDDVEKIFSTDQLRHFKECQHLQRWCNQRALIKSCPNFNEYEPYAKWVAKGKPVPGGGDERCK